MDGAVVRVGLHHILGVAVGDFPAIASKDRFDHGRSCQNRRELAGQCCRNRPRVQGVFGRIVTIGVCEQQLSGAHFQVVNKRLGEVTLGRVAEQAGDAEFLRNTGRIGQQAELGIELEEFGRSELETQVQSQCKALVVHNDQSECVVLHIRCIFGANGQFCIREHLEAFGADLHVEGAAHSEELGVVRLDRRNLEDQ